MHTDLQFDSNGAIWLDRSHRVSIDVLAELSGLNQSEVSELVELGVLAPADPSESPWSFSADCILTVRMAKRLRTDLELDMHALALALSLLEQIRALQTEVAKLRAQSPMKNDF
jgi:chaperone modulatory protein CbpM